MDTTKATKVIGLFGTCGGSTWRKPFVEEYARLGIDVFNPQVENWTPDCATIEAEHLASDDIILFPVLGESYGTGSLAEVGFAVLQTIREVVGRKIIVLIEQNLDTKLVEANPVAAKESVRARKLVAAHLAQGVKAGVFAGVYVVEDLAAMLKLSVELHGGHKVKELEKT